MSKQPRKNTRKKPSPKGEDIRLTPEEEAISDRSMSQTFEDMRLDGLPVFEPDFSKPLPPGVRKAPRRR